MVTLGRIMGQCMFGPKTPADEDALTGINEVTVSVRPKKSTKLTMVYVESRGNIRLYAAMSDEDNRLINDQNIIVTKIQSGKSKRSGLQNSAMHLYFTMLSEALNDAGWDMIAVLTKLFKEAAFPWSPLAVKERLWRGVQKHTFGTESTTDLDTDQVSVVYEALNVATTQKLGVGVPFPDRFMQAYEEDLKNGR